MCPALCLRNEKRLCEQQKNRVGSLVGKSERCRPGLFESLGIEACIHQMKSSFNTILVCKFHGGHASGGSDTIICSFGVMLWCRVLTAEAVYSICFYPVQRIKLQKVLFFSFVSYMYR